MQKGIILAKLPYLIWVFTGGGLLF